MDLVVAIYNENIDWIKKVPAERVFLYLKDSSRYEQILNDFPSAVVTILPNIGRESHTYLYHIVTHSNTLGKTTMFLQGNPFDHCTLDDILRLAQSSTEWYSPLGRHFVSDGNGLPDHPRLPVSNLYFRYFGLYRDTFVSTAGAQFLATRECIRKNSYELYKRLLLAHSEEVKLPWCIERYWPYIFSLT